MIYIVARSTSRLHSQCYLFLICVEIMGCMVRENKNITGLVINNNEHKLKQFADDCTCTFKSELSVHTLITMINLFSNVTGLKLNLEKSLLFIWVHGEIEKHLLWIWKLRKIHLTCCVYVLVGTGLIKAQLTLQINK